MKTTKFASVFLSLASIACGQEYRLPFEFGAQKQDVSLINKAGSEEDVLKSEKLAAPALKEAIRNYISALGPSTSEHALKKALGPLRCQSALNTLANINITVMFLDKSDPLEYSSTWRLPTLLGKGESFLIKVPYRFVKKDDSPARFEHMTMHELGHIVIGDLDHATSMYDSGNEKVDRDEKERRVEYINYLTVGKDKYTTFVKAWLKGEYPNISEKELDTRLTFYMSVIDRNVGLEK